MNSFPFKLTNDITKLIGRLVNIVLAISILRASNYRDSIIVFIHKYFLYLIIKILCISYMNFIKKIFQDQFQVNLATTMIIMNNGNQ